MYSWLVFVHLVGVVLFAISHGVSIAMAFSIRAERDPRIIASHLGNSLRATRITYVALLLLAIGGFGAAWSADSLGQGWVLASIGVLIVVLVAMWSVATPYYMRLRGAIAPDPATGQPPLDGDQLAVMLDSRRPDILAAVGGFGLLVLVWLMVLKPG